MGTNFYLKKGCAFLHPTPYAVLNNIDFRHIGKRNSAGLYCWDCGISLYKGDIKEIHDGTDGFYKKCPKCGKEAKDEKLEESASGREFGFNKQPYKEKTGVASCNSFTWAMSEEKRKILEKRLSYFMHEKTIENEYGEEFSYIEFLNILKECPIQLYYYKTRWS